MDVLSGQLGRRERRVYPSRVLRTLEFPVQTHAVAARSVHHTRISRMRPAYYLPLVLFVSSIVGGLAGLASQLPGPTL